MAYFKNKKEFLKRYEATLQKIQRTHCDNHTHYDRELVGLYKSALIQFGYDEVVSVKSYIKNKLDEIKLRLREENK